MTRHQLMPPMGAHVVKGAQFVIAASRDEQVLLVDFGGKERAGLSDLADVTGIVPCLVENRVFFQLIDFVAGLKPHRHGEGMGRVCEERRVCFFKI